MFKSKKKDTIVVFKEKRKIQKVNIMFFSGYKKRNNVRFMYLEPKLQQDSWFMHFQVKKPQNGKKNPFRDNETTNNEYLRFFDAYRNVPSAFWNSVNTLARESVRI